MSQLEGEIQELERRKAEITEEVKSLEMLGECRFCESPVLESDRWDVWDDGSVSHSECGGN